MLSLPVIETLVSVVTTTMTAGGLVALLLLMVVSSFGIPPLPSEVILPFAGFLVFSGAYTWPGAVVAALGGALLGAYIAYAVGRWGRHLLERPSGIVRLDPKHLRTVDGWFARHGEGTVILSNMIPFVRGYISYPAGTARMAPARFGVYTVLGNAPYTLALIYTGYYLGQRWTIIQSYFHIADYIVIAALVVLLVWIALRWNGVLAGGFPPRLAHGQESAPEPEGAASPPSDPDAPRS
jgi:membrane protein DedA with SNARE-associated domain